MQVSHDFIIQEFVPRIIWNKYGDRSVMFVDPKVIDLAQLYREYFGVPVRVNDWWLGGRLQQRGYRVPNTQTGALYSQHKRGAAFDCNIEGYTAREVYNEIRANQDYFMEFGLTTLENVDHTPTWIHSDIRTWPDQGDKLVIVNP